MALTLTSKLEVKLTATLSNGLDLSNPTDALTLQKIINLATGVAANQCDRIFHDTRSLTTGATEDLDLAASLTDPLGNTLTFATVKLLIVTAASTNTTILTLGNGTNPWVGPWGATGTCTVRPNGIAMNGAPGTGYTVTAGTGDILKVANAAGATASYNIAILGTSA